MKIFVKDSDYDHNVSLWQNVSMKDYHPT